MRCDRLTDRKVRDTMAKVGLRPVLGKSLIVPNRETVDTDGTTAAVQLESGLWAPSGAAVTRDTVGCGKLVEWQRDEIPLESCPRVWYNKWAALEIDDDLVCVRDDEILAYYVHGRKPVPWAMAGEYALLKPIETRGDRTQAGILLTEAYQEHFREGFDPDVVAFLQTGVGEVVVAGPGAQAEIGPGAQVLFEYRHAVYVEIDGVEHVIVRDDRQTVLAILPEAMVVKRGAVGDGHTAAEATETESVVSRANRAVPAGVA